MLIVALVLAVIGLAALVTAVVTSNELIAWVCIAASVIGVVLLIVDALRERSRGDAGNDEYSAPAEDAEFDAEYPEEAPADEEAETTEAPAETSEAPVENAEAPVENADEEVAGEDRNTR